MHTSIVATENSRPCRTPEASISRTRRQSWTWVHFFADPVKSGP